MKAFEVLTNSLTNDDCSAYGVTVANDLRNIESPLKRRRLMGCISNMLLGALEEQELESDSENVPPTFT